jgi:hypothetical protein
MIYVPKVPDPNERRIIWENMVVRNIPLRNLIDDLLAEKTVEVDTVRGVKPEDLAKKQGVVEGLDIAREIFKLPSLPTK